MRSLAGWDGVGGFLEFDDLLVHEAGTIVHNLHGVLRIADLTGTPDWFCDPATINIDFDCVIADLASEEGILHIWDDRGSANDEPFDGNDLVDI